MKIIRSLLVAAAAALALGGAAFAQERAPSQDHGARHAGCGPHEHGQHGRHHGHGEKEKQERHEQHK